jgi:hypothetical protein
MFADTQVMEKKIPWNLYVVESLANRIDAIARGNGKRGGNKGTFVSAACLMFLRAAPDERQKLIEEIKLAEVRDTPLLPPATPPTATSGLVSSVTDHKIASKAVRLRKENQGQTKAQGRSSA